MPFVLKANDLRNGEVRYWTGSAWSPVVGQGQQFATDAEAIAAPAPRAGVIDVYAIAVDAGQPATLRERINAIGPTVRPDLARPTGA